MKSRATRNRVESRQSKTLAGSFLWENGDPLFVLDLDGKILDANPPACRLTHYSLNELVAISWLHLCANSFPSLQELQLYADLGVNDSDVQFRLVSRMGQVIEASFRIFADPKHPESILVRVVRTRTGTQSAQYDRVDTQRWQQALESKELGVWDWRVESGEVYFSNRLAEMLGYSLEEFGNNLTAWEQLIHAGDKDSVWKDVEAYLSGESSIYLNEHRLKCKDGTYKWVQDQGKAVEWNESGKPTRLIGTHLDISQQKATEHLLAERSAQLSSVFELCPQGFLCASESHTVVSANPALYSIFGLEPGYIINRPLSELDSWLRQNCKFDKRFQGLVTLTEQLTKTPELAHTLKLRNGVILRVTGYSTSKISSSNGMVFCFQDISHQWETDQLKTEFLSNAAHELRTPMSSILGFSELLLDGQMDQATSIDLIQTIHQQATIIDKLINDLLDLVRIESRRGKELEVAEFNVGQLLNNLVSTFSTDSSACEIRIQPQSKPIILQADELKVQQCLRNVISNAIKYSPAHGKIEICLIEDSKKHLNQIGIAIEDHGIGMTAEQAGRIFERFYRANKNSEVPGTGLGMNIVKEIMDLHGGEIEVTSALGKGTTVTLWFPEHAKTN